MGEKRGLLLVDGPLDGQWVMIEKGKAEYRCIKRPPLPRIPLSIDDGSYPMVSGMIEEFRYTLRGIHVQKPGEKHEVVEFMAWDELSDLDCIRALVDRYKKGRPNEQE